MEWSYLSSCSWSPYCTHPCDWSRHRIPNLERISGANAGTCWRHRDRRSAYLATHSFNAIGASHATTDSSALGHPKTDNDCTIGRPNAATHIETLTNQLSYKKPTHFFHQCKWFYKFQQFTNGRPCWNCHWRFGRGWIDFRPRVLQQGR